MTELEKKWYASVERVCQGEVGSKMNKNDGHRIVPSAVEGLWIQRRSRRVRFVHRELVQASHPEIFSAAKRGRLSDSRMPTLDLSPSGRSGVCSRS